MRSGFGSEISLQNETITKFSEIITKFVACFAKLRLTDFVLYGIIQL